MKRYLLLIIITLSITLITGCARKFAVVSNSYKFSSVPRNEENATSFKIQESEKLTYNLVKESLESLSYEINKEIKFSHLEGSKGKQIGEIIITVDTIGTTIFIYFANVWLEVLSDKYTQVYIQVIVNEYIIEESKVVGSLEKIYRSESLEKEIISEFEKHLSGYFADSKDKMNDYNISSSIISGELLVEPIYTYMMHIRDGWMIGFSVGHGFGKSINPSGNKFLNNGGTSVGIRFGRMINPHFLINAEMDGWICTEEELSTETKYSLTNYILACTYYPGDPKTMFGGFYLRGGIGSALATVELSDNNSNEINENGFGFLLGAGYEFRISRKFALGIGSGYNKLFINGDTYFKSAQFIPILIDFNWYF
ncbi:MAG: porin family protein [Bacteroidales bacterium]|nr:porin family protein [Bacteroidales bacterium]